MITRVMKDLVRLRKRKMTASEAARSMEVSRQQIYNIESGCQGHPTILTVERYAKAIGVRVVVVDSAKKA